MSSLLLDEFIQGLQYLDSTIEKSADYTKTMRLGT